MLVITDILLCVLIMIHTTVANQDQRAAVVNFRIPYN
jgi:hypothetical protein